MAKPIVSNIEDLSLEDLYAVIEAKKAPRIKEIQEDLLPAARATVQTLEDELEKLGVKVAQPITVTAEEDTKFIQKLTEAGKTGLLVKEITKKTADGGWMSPQKLQVLREMHAEKLTERKEGQAIRLILKTT